MIVWIVKQIYNLRQARRNFEEKIKKDKVRSSRYNGDLMKPTQAFKEKYIYSNG